MIKLSFKRMGRGGGVTLILILGTLSKDVFERRTSTGSGLFAEVGSDLVETLG